MCFDEAKGEILLCHLHPRIGNFNDVAIFCMRCNHDIKFINCTTEVRAAMFYNSNYMTKPLVPVHISLAALSSAIQKMTNKFPGFTSESGGSDMQYQSALTMTVNLMIVQQEVVHSQVMSDLIEDGDNYRSDTFHILHWHAFHQLFCNTFPEEWDHPMGRYESLLLAPPNSVTTTLGESGAVDADMGSNKVTIIENSMEVINDDIKILMQVDNEADVHIDDARDATIQDDAMDINDDVDHTDQSNVLPLNSSGEDVTLVLGNGTISAISQQ